MSTKESFIDGKRLPWPFGVCYPNLDRAEYVRYTLEFGHQDRLTERNSDPKDTDVVVRVLMKAVSHGNAMVHEEDGYGPEWVEDMVGMILGLMMKVTGMSDCELGSLVAQLVKEFTPEGC